MAVAGQIGGGIAGKQKHLLTERTQSEAAVGARCWIEIRLSKYNKSAGRKSRPVRDSKLLRNVRTIGQEPSPNRSITWGRVEELDSISSQLVGFGQDFIDDDARDDGRGIVRAG